MQAPDRTTARQRRGANEVSALADLFEALDDSTLIAALERTRWTGRPGYPVRAMWRALIASFSLNIVHDTDLVRALHSNPALAQVCGFKRPPTKYAICRFRRKLTHFNAQVSEVLKAATNALHEALPDFGQEVAVDATDVKAWANRLHENTDPDAALGAKPKSGVLTYWRGYKVHLAVDADAELPVWFTLTPANAYDGAQLAPVLNEARSIFPWFQPTYVSADKGYDSREAFRFIGEDLRAIPVIDVQKTHMPRGARNARECEAKAEITPQGVRYRCNRLPWDPFCSRFGKCPLLPVFVDSPLNAADLPYPERYSPFPYGSDEWKRHYNKRVSVERTFSRLKTYRKLNSVRTRRYAKVWLHVALSVLVMNVAATVSTAAGVSARRCVA